MWADKQWTDFCVTSMTMQIYAAWTNRLLAEMFVWYGRPNASGLNPHPAYFLASIVNISQFLIVKSHSINGAFHIHSLICNMGMRLLDR